MIVSGLKELDDFVQKNAQAEKPLNDFIAKVKSATWKSHADVVATFGTAVVYLKNGRYKFKIGGNKYRLIAVVLFVGGTLIVRYIGTHADYDKINALEI